MDATIMASAGRSLVELLSPWARVAPADERVITGLALDSRDVRPGSLFVAMPGSRQHGLDFLSDAVRRGAVAVVYQLGCGLDAAGMDELAASAGVPLIEMPALRRDLSALAARFYGEPSRSMSVIGVTGTDGKTSVSQFLAQALSTEQTPCGVIGTLGYGLLGALAPGAHTTPDAITVQRLLAEMRASGARYCAMEVSSHALDQGRVEAVRFTVAVLTNLTRDHLDYHKTERAYADAKARLFAMPGLRHAVLNRDDAFGRRIMAELPAGVRCWDYSLDPQCQTAAVICRKLEYLPDGLRLEVQTRFGTVTLRLRLLGRFNAANALAVLATLLALGLPLAEAARRVEALRPVTGRMECFGGPQLPLAIVDYAHTPAGLAAALDAVRAHAIGNVWCVFGCGGDRDRGKRPQMGAVADAKADEIVLTDDNPRTEDPERIIREILVGIERHEPFIVRDRAVAIRLALESAGPADVVLIAGKGHEVHQIVGTQKLPFDDREQVQRVLQELQQWNR